MKAVILLSLGAIIVGTPYTASPERITQESGVRENWIDDGSGLIWTIKDNGRNVTWMQANKYCSNLRSSGYSDWRLPTIDELEGIYDGSGFSAPPPRGGVQRVLAGKPRGGLTLTGNHHWSSTKARDDRGHMNGYAWYFDFSHGKRDWDPYGYHGSKRALCVRHSRR